eukprot:344303-Chlamydomonas_euryale.AAC.7
MRARGERDQRAKVWRACAARAQRKCPSGRLFLYGVAEGRWRMGPAQLCMRKEVLVRGWSRKHTRKANRFCTWMPQCVVPPGKRRHCGWRAPPTPSASCPPASAGRPALSGPAASVCAKCNQKSISPGSGSVQKLDGAQRGSASDCNKLTRLTFHVSALKIDDREYRPPFMARCQTRFHGGAHGHHGLRWALAELESARDCGQVWALDTDTPPGKPTAFSLSDLIAIVIDTRSPLPAFTFQPAFLFFLISSNGDSGAPWR